VIHAFALEPKVVATWGRRDAYRFFYDKFGLGTPRVLFELPNFTNWTKAVFTAAGELALSEEDLKRVEVLCRILGESRCRRQDSKYEDALQWLVNAEREYDRSPFRAIVASENPRGHRAVLEPENIGPACGAWDCVLGTVTRRVPHELANAISAMLLNCDELHLVDPYFGPENARHRKVLEALMREIARRAVLPTVVRVHCSGNPESRPSQSFFEEAAAKMAARLPTGCAIEFARWKQKEGGEKIHNRYVLTDLGGVFLGDGLDEGKPGETDNLSLLTREQYLLRWSQYVQDVGAFERVDTPKPLEGKGAARSS